MVPTPDLGFWSSILRYLSPHKKFLFRSFWWRIACGLCPPKSKILPTPKEGTFRSCGQAATSPPVYHTQWWLNSSCLFKTVVLVVLVVLVVQRNCKISITEVKSARVWSRAKRMRDKQTFGKHQNCDCLCLRHGQVTCKEKMKFWTHAAVQQCCRCYMCPV